jgi:4-hydroxybenzoate polyprenyltransferase
MRLPNVFTAMADVMMGFCFYRSPPPIAAPFSPAWHGRIDLLVLLLASSCCLYLAGMVLNDVFDLEVDRIERPRRPLPSGRVTLTAAKQLGWALSIAGVLFGSFAMRANSATAKEMTWGDFLVGHGRPIIVAVAILILIVGYNRWLKRTSFGPITMGGCRFLNVLLGMSASGSPWTTANYAVAAGVGVYVVGLTAFAKREAAASNRRDLTIAFLAMLAGVGLLWWFPNLLSQWAKVVGFNFLYWTFVWIVVAAHISWRFIHAIIWPGTSQVQAAVKSGIMSIIVLDSLAAFAVGGFYPSLTIALLLVPAIFLGRWVYST